MSNNMLDKFKYSGGRIGNAVVGANTGVPKSDPFKTPMPTFWAVEEPHVINDAIPRDMRATATNQSGVRTPTMANLKVFSSHDDAIRYAQSLNRPLVILEISTINKILPQLPQVVKYLPPKEERQVETLTKVINEEGKVEFKS